MSTENHEEFEQDDRPEPSSPSMGEMVAKAVVKGAAFGAGMARRRTGRRPARADHLRWRRRRHRRRGLTAKSDGPTSAERSWQITSPGWLGHQPNPGANRHQGRCFLSQDKQPAQGQASNGTLVRNAVIRGTVMGITSAVLAPVLGPLAPAVGVAVSLALGDSGDNQGDHDAMGDITSLG